MYFVRFPVATTNIFPAANSVTGSQLVTEFNLRSIDSVATAEKIQYMVGPSYVHGQSDFFVRIQQDGAGTVISSTTLEILPGRAVVNGHYVENLSSMLVDLAEANAEISRNKGIPLRGDLEIGIRAMYSTEPTMAGAIMIENKENMWEGIQLVIEPKLILPEDSPDDLAKVNAHIRLATFRYINGQLTVPDNCYPEKCQCYEASRLKDLDSLSSGLFLTKAGLNPKHLYILSGKGVSSVDRDYWCAAEDSLVIWDANPELSTDRPDLKESEFRGDADGKTRLYLPHKQVDEMTNQHGDAVFFQPKVHELPLADYDKGTPGTVDRAFTRRIKDVAEKINEILRMPAGKQIWFIDVLDNKASLPSISPSWKVGDYILVSQDLTVPVTGNEVRCPSTMYSVIPGTVKKIKFLESRKDSKLPSSLTGYQIDNTYGTSAPNTTDPEVYNAYWGDILTGNYVGEVKTDYFVYIFEDGDAVTYYYYAVDEAGPFGWSEAVWLTGEIPFAQTDVIGGFLNVSDTDVDGGYVIRDSDGHLRLLDYGLLRTGVLAYQLGEDFKSPGGIAALEIQTYLDEYVNNRVAFPNPSHIENAENPAVINITLTLTKEENPVSIVLRDIDSRFGTSICLNIRGTADENTVISIINCEKVRINNNIEGSPTIHLYRSGLYYDPYILNYLGIIQDLKLWYERYSEEDPNLLVDNMTVLEVDAPVHPETLEFWETIRPNDIHYKYALHSLTFGSDGNIIGFSLVVANETTVNLDTEKPFISVAEFLLPNGYGLQYPEKRLTRPMKVTGSFVTAYADNDPNGYRIMSTSFSALTGVWNPYSEDSGKYTKGSIAFFTRVDHVEVPSELGGANIPAELREPVSIDPWETKSYNIFTGGVVE